MREPKARSSVRIRKPSVEPADGADRDEAERSRPAPVEDPPRRRMRMIKTAVVAAAKSGSACTVAPAAK